MVYKMKGFSARSCVIVAALLLSSCIVETNDATDITPDGARLRGTLTCETGDCDIYFEYWQRDAGAEWAVSTTQFEFRGIPQKSSWPVYADITGLESDTHYEFRLCGRESVDSEFLCDLVKTFRTSPPTEIEQFSAVLSARNIVTLTWETSGGTVGEPVHIYGEFHDPVTGEHHRNVGYRAEHDNTDGLTFRVRPGLHRYVLELPTAAGKVTKVYELNVPAPTSPVITSPANSLYPVNISDQTVTWPALAADEFMLIRPPGQPSIEVTGQNSHTFTAQYLEDTLGEGEHAIGYFTCVDMSGAKPAMSRDFCSSRSRNPIIIGSARFTGPERHFAAPGGSVTLSWDNTGDSTVLTAPSVLGGVQTTTAFSHTFTNLPIGIHDISLESCISTPADCANTEDVVSPVSGHVVAIENQLSIFLAYGLAGASVGDQLALIQLDNSTTQVPVLASGVGNITEAEPNFQVGQHVNAGDVLMVQQTAAPPRAQIVVSNDNFERRHWKQDFYHFFPARHDLPNTSHVRLGATMPLLVASDGSIWSGGEFSDGGLTHITGINASEVISVLATPLLTIPSDPGPVPDRLEPVKPFDQASFSKSSLTKQEYLIEAGDYIWSVNGGSDHAVPGTNDNWNRLIRFDRAATDSAATLQDDRFCVYHVPTNNAGVIGIDWDETNGRIWYVEGRAKLDVAPVLAWFDPNELSCENFIDYSDPASIASATTQYCASPGDSGCIRTISLEDSDGSGRKLAFAAHAKADVDAVWVAGYNSSNIARVDIATEQVDVLDTDPPSVTPGTVASFLGSGPWQFLVEGDHVYFTEFFDGDIVKLDKTALAMDLASQTYACKDTGGGDNPCMEEIHATQLIKEIDLHGDRLYFGGYTEFGYINFSAWTPGALYSGLEEARDPERARIGKLISGDLSVGNTGMVIVNDYNGRSIMRFYPKAG